MLRYAVNQGMRIDMLRYAVNQGVFTRVLRYAVDQGMLTGVLRYAVDQGMHTDMLRYVNAGRLSVCLFSHFNGLQVCGGTRQQDGKDYDLES